jgi:uncharacterized protein
MVDTFGQISPWIRKFASWIIAYPKTNLLVLAIVTALLGSGVLLLQFDPSTERIFPEGHSAVKNFREFRELFGNDEFLLVAYTAKEPILSRGELARIQDLTKKLEHLTVQIGADKKSVTPVRSVRSLTNTPNVTLDLKVFPPRPQIIKLYNKAIHKLTDSELEKARRSILASPFVKPLLLSPDGRSSALVLELTRGDGLTDREAAEQVMELVREARELVQREISSKGLEGHVAGSPVVKADIVATIERELVIFTLPLVLISAFVSFFIFRNIRGVIVPMVVILATSIFVYGIMGFLEIGLHPMTTLLSPLIFVVGIADSVHVLVEIENSLAQRSSGDSLYDAIHRATALVLPPCFVTSLTTTIGFGSLVISDIAPVAEFGFLAAIGTSLAFVLTFSLVPAIWLLLPDRAIEPGQAKRAPRVDGLGRFVMRATHILGAASLIFGVYCVSKLPDISFNTDFVGFFKEDTAVKRGVRFIQKNFAGIASIEIVVKGKKKQLRDPEVLQAMLDFEGDLLSLPEIDAAFSGADFLVFARNRMLEMRAGKAHSGIPDAREISAMERLFAGMSGDKDEMRRFVSADEDQARITVRVKTMGSERMSAVLKAIRVFREKRFDSSMTVVITGTPVIFSETSFYMMKGQMHSFFWALLTITLVMIVALKSFRLGLLSLIPNLFPIAVTFGFMALFEIPMNSFNSMVASVAIGIAVDDTIHVLIGYRRFRAVSEMHEALQETIAHTGAAVLSTSLLLACGFGVLMLGDFRPTGHFGFLTCVAIISAVIGDLFLLPGLIILDEKIFGSCVKKSSQEELGLASSEDAS